MASHVMGRDTCFPSLFFGFLDVPTEYKIPKDTFSYEKRIGDKYKLIPVEADLDDALSIFFHASRDTENQDRYLKMVGIFLNLSKWDDLAYLVKPYIQSPSLLAYPSTGTILAYQKALADRGLTMEMTTQQHAFLQPGFLPISAEALWSYAKQYMPTLLVPPQGDKTLLRWVKFPDFLEFLTDQWIKLLTWTSEINHLTDPVLFVPEVVGGIVYPK